MFINTIMNAQSKKNNYHNLKIRSGYMSIFFDLPPIFHVLFASLAAFIATGLGASIVFFLKKVKKSILDSMLGFSAGIMLAAAFWSLLDPAIKMVNKTNLNYLLIALAFIFGALFLYFGDKFFSYYEKKYSKNKTISFKRSAMLIFSITLHNIPEGLAIGTAFGTSFNNANKAMIISSLVLTLGIAIQNFPEGLAVSLPLYREGYKKKKAFIIGLLSAIVEPIAALIGFYLASMVTAILPFLLSFAAGAMIYVVVKELIPESQNNENKEFITLITMFGFVIMMVFDILLN